MKNRYKSYSKSTISVALAICMVLSCVTVSLIPTGAAAASDVDIVGNTDRIVYFSPYEGENGTGWISENKTIGARYQRGTNDWGSAAGSDTGRTIGGKRVYTVTVDEQYEGLDNLYFRGADNVAGLENSESNQIHAISGYFAFTNWENKYYNGSGWVNPSYDTFLLKSGNDTIATFAYSSGLQYTASATLNRGTTYSFYLSDGTNSWRNDVSGTYSETTTKNMYRYGQDDDSHVFKVQPTVTGTYTFTWTLNGLGNRCDAGSLKVTFPTYYTINYTLGSNVSKASPFVTNGDDMEDGTIRAVSGSNVSLNVAYATNYEYDGNASSLDGATPSNDNQTFTYSGISSNKTISIAAKQSKFNVQVTAGTGGTVSPASFTDLDRGEGGEITATPTPNTNYVFAGWSASPAENVTFLDPGSATTTFTATGAATITASFTLETIFSVDVYADGSTHTTVNAGSTINPTITRTDRSADDYDFTGWLLTGDVELANGYSATDPTIKVKATGAGGSVTAQYTHVNYIYFYGALQSNWNGDGPVVTVDGTEVAPYAWIAKKGDDQPKTLYSGTAASSTIGGNNVYTYYIGVYRVSDEKVGKGVCVFNSVKNSTQVSDGYCGTLQNDQGRCYYTYSTGTNNNYTGTIVPQEVTAVTPDAALYDLDDTVTVEKTETIYCGTKTAGQDDFKYTFRLQNTSTNTLITLESDLASSQGTYTFVPQTKGVPAGTYRFVITTRDVKTNKITNSCSSNEIVIRNIPTTSNITFSQTTSNAHSSFTGTYTYKDSTVHTLTSGTTLRAGAVVTLELTLNAGYTQGTTTLTGISSAGESYVAQDNKVTFTFTVPANVNSIDVSHAAAEVMHDIVVKNGVTGAEIERKQAGVVTEAILSAPPAQAYYHFTSWTIPGTLTQTVGTTTTNGQIKVTAQPTAAQSVDVTINYEETLHTITLTDDGNGTIQLNNAAAVSANIGFITNVTLNAQSSLGYSFKEWQITKNTATRTVVNGTTYNLSGETLTIGKNTAPYQTTFKFDGTATVKAVFEPVGISLQASFSTGNEYSNSNTVRVTNTSGTLIDSGHINTAYVIEVTLGDGYEVDSITGASGTMPTPTKNGNVWKYQYTITDITPIAATVTLKAATPTLTNAQIKDTTFEFVNLAANINHYYLQPVVAKAQTDSFSTLSYYIGNGTPETTGIASGAEVSMTPNSSIRPATTDDNKPATYTLTITATNAPAGVTKETTTASCTIKVRYNAAQKVYFNLDKLLARCIRENESNNPYYSVSAPIAAYNTAYDAVYTFHSWNWPAYNADAAAVTNGEVTYNATTIYNDFLTAYGNLLDAVTKTTINVLSKVSNNSSAPVNIRIYPNSNGENHDDYKHFKMYVYRLIDSEMQIVTSDENNFKMSYKGTVAKDGTTYYWYTFEYAGHANFKIWKGSSATDVSDSANGKKLTETVNNATEFKQYYVNVYDINPGNGSMTECEEWRNFGHIKAPGKKSVEKGVSKSGSQIMDLLQIQAVGSMVTAPGITTTPVSYTIEGPVGKASSREYNLLNNTEPFPAAEQGKYKVRYTTRFGYLANGTEITSDIEVPLWVAYDDITIYVDMNNNVGNPILNFLYHTDAAGNPSASGTVDAYLPYEMELVTGSESVYRYTIKTTKMREDYLIQFEQNVPINISYITVEDRKIGELTGGFDIQNDARASGEIWFKADSTHLETFHTISYGSVNESFAAVAEDSDHTILTAVKSMHGTGIVTDDAEIYHSRYAAYDEDLQNRFNYVLRTTLNEEVKRGNTTYYFDRWVKIATPEDGLVPNENNGITLTSDDLAETYSTSPDLNFTGSKNYSTGDESYIALYKPVSSNDETVRVEVTYNFKDYDTSDNNYIFDEHKDKVDVSYTKTIKATDTLANVQTNLEDIVEQNAPLVKSNYFTYAFGEITSTEANAEESKITVQATLTESEREYTIIAKYGTETIEYNGNYQQTAELKVSDFTAAAPAHPVWTDNKNQPMATGDTFTARFTSSGDETGESQDCQVIKLIESDATVENKSVIANGFTEADNDSATAMLHHNFYIIDYCAEGKLIGGGVLYVTTDAAGNYRQASASAAVNTKANRLAFINSVLRNDYSQEYTAQTITKTINNVEAKSGFRYLPFRSKDDVYRYSSILGAYHYTYEANNINSEQYAGQKLRMYSFMVYNTGTEELPNYVVVPSEGYAEVDRYIEP